MFVLLLSTMQSVHTLVLASTGTHGWLRTHPGILPIIIILARASQLYNHVVSSMHKRKERIVESRSVVSVAAIKVAFIASVSIAKREAIVVVFAFVVEVRPVP
jgi:ABC-type uncharacterized transport system permease subunit